MFFFSGFGSIVPYIVYISLIWVCILFGFRLSISELLKFKHSDNCVSVPASNSLDTAHLSLLSYTQQKNNHAAPQLDMLTKFMLLLSCFNITDEILFPAFLPPPQSAFAGINHLLRAPPARWL